jgi:hypothetical protein
MFGEPEKRLSCAAELGYLVENERDRFLDAAVGILLDAFADLHEPDRGGNDQLAAPCLLVAGRQGALVQEIELTR